MKLLTVLLSLFIFIGCTSNNKGKKAPAFSAHTIDNKEIDTEKLKGKIIVLKIWATWCGMCITEIPQLNKLVEKYKNDEDVIFVAITDDHEQKITNFLSNRPFNYQHIVDSKKLKLLYQTGLIKEIPEHIIIDQEGNVVMDVSGQIGNIAAQLDDKIQELKK